MKILYVSPSVHLSVDLSVRLSVCQMRDCDKAEERSVQIFIPYESSLVFPNPGIPEIFQSRNPGIEPHSIPGFRD